MTVNSSPSIYQALLALGVNLPLRPSETDSGVVLDADDRDVFTVDSNGFQPDDQVKALATLIATCVNQSGGIILPVINYG